MSPPLPSPPARPAAASVRRHPRRPRPAFDPLHFRRLRQAHRRFPATAGWFGSIGLPVLTVTAVVVGLVELLGGLAILRGLPDRASRQSCSRSSPSARPLIAHLDFADQIQLLLFMKNPSIAGGFLVPRSLGAGALSVDGRRG